MCDCRPDKSYDHKRWYTSLAFNTVAKDFSTPSLVTDESSGKKVLVVELDSSFFSSNMTDLTDQTADTVAVTGQIFGNWCCGCECDWITLLHHQTKCIIAVTTKFPMWILMRLLERLRLAED